MNQTQSRVKKVLERMITLTENDEDYSLMFAMDLESFLENFLMDDAFGTEGQNDPRGDGRDGTFSMERVQGSR